jgi:DNA-directed RNA polymerase subunit RPC12/RpoP
MIIPPENYSVCLRCPHVYDDDEGLYCDCPDCGECLLSKNRTLSQDR